MDNDLIIGIEINKKYCNIGYYDLITNEVVHVDTSGGYGKVSFPCEVLYVKGTDDWIFGERAVEGDIYEDTIVFNSILDIAYSGENFINLGGNNISIDFIIKKFLSELIGIISNIKPKGVVKKITLYYEKYKNFNCEETFIKAFELMNFSREIIYFVNLEDLILSNIKMMENDSSDFEILYLGTDRTIYAYNDENSVLCDLNYKMMENKINKYLTNLYCERFPENELSEHVKWKIASIIYHNKDLMYNKYLNKQYCKIYFNFCYPAIECKINYEDLKSFFTQLENLKDIIKSNNVYVISDCFTWDFVTKEIFKNIAYKKIQIINAIIYFSYNNSIKIGNGKFLNLENKNIIKNDIGLIIYENGKKLFYPLIKKGTTIPLKKIFYDFHIADNVGEIDIIQKIDNLDKKIGSFNIEKIQRFSQVEISVSCEDKISVSIVDKGLGQLIKSSGYSSHLYLNL